MKSIIVLGAQWGDEGKGKIVDIYSEFADTIVRPTGGNNAGHTLVVKGEKKESREENKGDSHLSERRYGSFERNFRIPEGVDPGKIEATLKNGVLTVVLPKKAEAVKPATKIEVKAA